MKKILAMALAILMFAGLSVVCPAAGKPVDLLKNGSFEVIRDDGTPENWILDYGEWGKEATIEKTGATDGTKAFHVVADEQDVYFRQTVWLNPGIEYTVQFKLRANKPGGSGRISIEFLPSGIQKSMNPTFEPTTEWETYEAKFTPAEGISRVDFYLVTVKGSDLVWDSVSVLTPPGEELEPLPNDTYVPAHKGAANKLTNPGFEELDKNGAPVGWFPVAQNGALGKLPSDWKDHQTVMVDNEIAHTGNNSVRLTLGVDGWPTYSYVHQQIPVKAGTRYQISVWVRTDILTSSLQGARIRFYLEFFTGLPTDATTYHPIDWSASTPDGTPEKACRWEQVVGYFTPYKDTEIADCFLWVYNAGGGSVWVDDFEVVPMVDESTMEFHCDQYFYYEDAETGYGNVTVSDEEAAAMPGATVDFTFFDKDGTTVLKEQKGTKLTEGMATFAYPISLIQEMKTPYTIKAVIKDAEGNAVAERERRVYRYNRPTKLTKDGQYIGKDGNIITPVVPYGSNKGDDLMIQELKDLGYNFAIISSGASIPYAANNGNHPLLKRWMDELAENDMYAFIFLGVSSHNASSPLLREMTEILVRDFKDHPAMGAWFVQDEPFDMQSDPELELETSYRLIRDIDDRNPVYIVDNSHVARLMAKYADFVAADPYPSYPRKIDLFPAPYNTCGSNPAVYASEFAQIVRPTAERYGKLYQNMNPSFDYNGYLPSTSELRSFFYQGLFEGTTGVSWYTLNDILAMKESKGIDYEGFFSKFAKEEQNLAFELFGPTSTYPQFNRFDSNDFSYESVVKDGKLYMMIINRHATEQKITVSLRSQNGLVVASGTPEELYLEGESVKPTVSGETLTVTIPPVNISLIRLNAPNATAEMLSAAAFDDLAGYDWAAEAIEKLYAADILSADAVRAFAPGKAITRGDFAKYLMRALDLECLSSRGEMKEGFADVPKDAPYYREVTVGKSLGVLRGIGDNKFNPEAPITRQDLMVICQRGLRKAFKAGADMADLSIFSDNALLADYAIDAVSQMNAAGIVKGNADGTLNPLGNTTRAEAAVIMERIHNIK